MFQDCNESTVSQCASALAALLGATAAGLRAKLQVRPALKSATSRLYDSDRGTLLKRHGTKRRIIGVRLLGATAAGLRAKLQVGPALKSTTNRL